MIKSSWIIIKIQEKGQELLHVKQVMTSAQEKSRGKLVSSVVYYNQMKV